MTFNSLIMLVSMARNAYNCSNYSLFLDDGYI